MPEQRRVVVGVTGAGGTRLAGVLLNKLVDDERVGHVDVMVSANGRELVAFENGADENADAVALLLGEDPGTIDKISVWDPEVDQAGPPSSGSYRFTDMIVLPCALGAAARIAHGVANTLLERGADVCLKERRRLVLCIRETPLNLIHLRNLVQLTEAGAVVYPMIPTYYNVPQNLQQMDEEFVLRLLGFIGLDQTDYFEWKDTSGTPALHDHSTGPTRRPDRAGEITDGHRRSSTRRAVRLIVGMTGATGAPLGVRLLEVLRDLDDVETHLVLSRWARTTVELETAYTAREVAKLADVVYGAGDQAAAISSGSFLTAGMVIVPCSMKTLAGIRTGYADGLIARAADVCLKERRRLVLVPRETPLNDVHLENMLALSRMGATVFPPVPAFYNQPTSLADMIDHLVVRILDQFGISAPAARRWAGP